MTTDDLTEFAALFRKAMDDRGHTLQRAATWINEKMKAGGHDMGAQYATTSAIAVWRMTNAAQRPHHTKWDVIAEYMRVPRARVAELLGEPFDRDLIPADIGERVKDLRARTIGDRSDFELLSSELFGHDGRITAGTLAEYESGRRQFTPALLTDVARVLGVDVMSLIETNAEV